MSVSVHVPPLWSPGIGGGTDGVGGLHLRLPPAVPLDVALAAWLVDSIYDGVTAETFMNSDLRFTMFPGGAVKYDRIPAN